MKFCHELYDASYNYVKGCSSVMRYFNELILKPSDYVSMCFKFSFFSKLNAK
jgi:hypothetical protein